MKAGAVGSGVRQRRSGRRLGDQRFEARAAAVAGFEGDPAQRQPAGQLAGREVLVALGMGQQDRRLADLERVIDLRRHVAVVERHRRPARPSCRRGSGPAARSGWASARRRGRPGAGPARAGCRRDWPWRCRARARSAGCPRATSAGASGVLSRPGWSSCASSIGVARRLPMIGIAAPQASHDGPDREVSELAHRERCDRPDVAALQRASRQWLPS